MNKTIFENKKIRIKISLDPFQILEIKDLETKTTYCTKGVQSVIIRTPSHISDPAYLYELDEITVLDETISFTLTDDVNENSAVITLTKNINGIKFHVSAKSKEVIWLIEYKLTGFTFDEVIVPALGGQSLSSEMPAETTLSYKYPFWWNAQFVLGAKGKNGLYIYTRDNKPELKLLRVQKTSEHFNLSIGFEAEGPLKKNTLEGEFFIDSYKDDWRIAVDKHRNWLEPAFNLTNIQDNPSFPAWTNNINFILELWGMRKDQAEPHHTFEQMIDRLKEFRKYHNPENTLVYITGFAEHGIDSNAPDYKPGIKCGGEEKFIKLMDAAHKMKYKVMLHTNVLALTFQHRIYNEFKKYQVVDVFNRPLGWAMDIDGDWLAEEYFAYVNPGYTQWGDYMQNVIGELINKYKTDAVFLDQTLLAFNVSKGPNFMRGMRNYVKRMSETFPDTLFAGEGLNEQVLSALPFAQIHGIDSLSEVHGMEGNKTWRKVHPVSTYLFNKYTRFSAHLLTRYPAHHMFKLQEKAYEELNVIPALCLYDYKQKMDIPETKKMINRAKKLNKIFDQQIDHYNKLERQ